MRILHTNMHHHWGGQPNRILTTCLGLRDLGHEVCIATPRNAILADRAKAVGIRVLDSLELRRGFRINSISRDIKSLSRHFAEFDYDVIDTHGSQDTWLIAYYHFLFRQKSRPVFIRTRHNVFPVRANLGNRWLYRNYVDHVVTISPQVIPLLESVISPNQCTSIYSAPDQERFQLRGKREKVRRELGFNNQDKVVGVVARLAPEKGHHYLIEASVEILKKEPTTKFLFIGKGRSENLLKEQITQLGLEEKFTFLGFREDIPSILEAVDLFVLPSIDGESLGTSILEAFLMENLSLPRMLEVSASQLRTSLPVGSCNQQTQTNSLVLSSTSCGTMKRLSLGLEKEGNSFCESLLLSSSLRKPNTFTRC